MKNKLKAFVNNEIKECTVLCHGYTAKHFTQKQIKEVYINQIFGAIMFAQNQLGVDFKACDELYVDACDKIRRGIK